MTPQRAEQLKSVFKKAKNQYCSHQLVELQESNDLYVCDRCGSPVPNLANRV